MLISYSEAERQRGYPLRAGPFDLVETSPGDLDPLDRQALGLLLAGLTDQAIAGRPDRPGHRRPG
ncbi:hypothetical protein OHA21_03840 [Actinoplanes sp. NBC_00393]|uniref:hypothetical protein n=1 Tax=Actinoplanes sp. NBC_00393 TaxID=2975953 RepID=UPI002E1B1C3E